MTTSPGPALPYLDVETTPDSEQFWAELGRGNIVVDWCAVCDTYVWPAAKRCRACMTAVAAERTLSGHGAIYSYAVVHRGVPAMKAATPYVLAYVTLDDGPTVMSNIVDSPPEQLAVGAPVEFVGPSGEVAAGAFRFRTT